MKYFTLLLLLTGCASMPVPDGSSRYFNPPGGHATRAKWDNDTRLCAPARDPERCMVSLGYTVVYLTPEELNK